MKIQKEANQKKYTKKLDKKELMHILLERCHMICNDNKFIEGV
jgi:hypothetical protein